jgi:hypothetical protein
MTSQRPPRIEVLPTSAACLFFDKGILIHPADRRWNSPRIADPHRQLAALAKYGVSDAHLIAVRYGGSSHNFGRLCFTPTMMTQKPGPFRHIVGSAAWSCTACDHVIFERHEVPISGHRAAVQNVMAEKYSVILTTLTCDRTPLQEWSSTGASPPAGFHRVPTLQCALGRENQPVITEDPHRRIGGAALSVSFRPSHATRVTFLPAVSLLSWCAPSAHRVHSSPCPVSGSAARRRRCAT